jgi:hypothetical protein
LLIETLEFATESLARCRRARIYFHSDKHGLTVEHDPEYWPINSAKSIIEEPIRCDEKAGLLRNALSSQIIDALAAHKIRGLAMKKASTKTVRRMGKQ